MLADENIRKGLEAKVSAAEKELSQFQVGCIIFIITTEDLIFFFFSLSVLLWDHIYSSFFYIILFLQRVGV